MNIESMDYLSIKNTIIDFVTKYKYIFIIVLGIIFYEIWFYYKQKQIQSEFSFDNINEKKSISVTKDFPPIRMFEHVLTPEECKEIIQLGEPRLERSLLDDGVNGKTGSARTSSQAWIKPTELSCLEKLSHYVSKITGLPVQNQEEWQLLRYYPGQEYKHHYDAASPNTEDYEAMRENDRKRGWGQRVYTFFIYLNDVPEGGETDFPRIGVRVQPIGGTAILWENLTKDRKERHILSEHAGMPVKKGVKWAINVWIREKSIYTFNEGIKRFFGY